MSNYGNFIETVNGLLLDARDKEVINLNVGKVKSQTNNISVGEEEFTSFGSCSYLGLEFDQRIKNGAIEAIHNFGTQFSSSRAYLSIGLYEEYESLLSQIFGSHTIVTPTTSLGHIAAIPNQVGDQDAVIMDHQVHTSVQVAVNLLKPRKIHVELVRHNNMDRLEERIKELSKKYKKVWYMADGVYSMYGDILQYEQLSYFLNKYEKFHLYVDDAHGMSIAGKHGRGLTLNKMELHDKMIVATSFAKGFATGGGALIFPNKHQIDITRNCASPLVTSGPLQPANLGAGVAAAKIHLTNEIYDLQEGLMDNINYTNILLKNSSLPAVFNSQTPIFFIGTSVPKVAYNIINKMKKDGHYLNLGMFPAVPMKNTGVRFTITRLHTFEQIEKMVKDLEKNYHEALFEENFDEQKIYRAFKIKSKEESFTEKITKKLEDQFALKTIHKSTITEISQLEWDRVFKGVGSFDWEGVQLLEKTFKNNAEDYNNWDFDYLLVKDDEDKIVAATFFTTALSKDDMFAPEEASVLIERKRLKTPNYLVSKTLFMGSLFTEGNHLHLDTKHPKWKAAMNIVFEKIDELKVKYQAENVILRDFDHISDDLNRIFIDNGYYKSEFMERWENNDLDFHNENEFLSSLTYERRRKLKKEVLPFLNQYKTKIYSKHKGLSDDKIDHWYTLYNNVKSKSLSLNTFPLPKKLFKEVVLMENWEVIEFISIESNKVEGVVLSNINEQTYSPMLIGIDYESKTLGSVYRQALYFLVTRANKLKKTKLSLGFSAGVEKKKVGANPVKSYVYLCTDTTYSQQVIANMDQLEKTNVKSM